MADPSSYTPSYSFTDWQTANPTKPLPAPQVDNELWNISEAIEGLVNSVKDIRRSDGALQNGIVTVDSLSSSLTLGFSFIGVWQPGVRYNAGDGVTYGTIAYRAKISHLSTNDNRPDISSGTWAELYDLIDFVNQMTFADQVEAEAGTADDLIMSPLRTAQQIAARIASKTQAEAGVDNTALMTPLRTKEAIVEVASINADGGFTSDLTGTPTIPWLGPFGGTWNAKHRFSTTLSATHAGASYATVSVSMRSTGSGANGPGNSDYAAFFSSAKESYLTSAVEGEVDVQYITARQGQYDDVGGTLTDIEKVGGGTGGVTVHESAAKWVDSSGAVVKRQQAIKNYLGQGSGFYSASGVSGIGFWTEAQVGSFYSAFHADQVGSGAIYENLITHTQGRLTANTIYKVDGAGRTQASPTADASVVSYGFVGDENTGLRRLSADAFGAVTGGVDRWVFDSAGAFWPISDNAYDIGAVSTQRVRNLYIVNSPTVGSDERDKIWQDFELDLRFMLALTPRAYRLRTGGVGFQTVEEEIEEEEFETEEKEVSIEEYNFNGVQMVKSRRKVIEKVAVYDTVPVIDEDGKQIVETILQPEIDDDGNEKRDERGRVILTRIERPAFVAVPRKRKVKKIVSRSVPVDIEGKRIHYGFGAQDVKRLLDAFGVTDFGGWVKTDPSDPDSREALRYEQFIPVLTANIQELAGLLFEGLAHILSGDPITDDVRAKLLANPAFADFMAERAR